MKTVQIAFSLSAVTASALFLASMSGNAATSQSCRQSGLSPAECACQIALDSGSRNALARFIRNYPRADTACNATASTAIDANDRFNGTSSSSRNNLNGPASSSIIGTLPNVQPPAGTPPNVHPPVVTPPNDHPPVVTPPNDHPPVVTPPDDDDDRGCKGKGGGNCGGGKGDHDGNGTGNEGNGNNKDGNSGKNGKEGDHDEGPGKNH